MFLKFLTTCYITIFFKCIQIINLYKLDFLKNLENLKIGHFLNYLIK